MKRGFELFTKGFLLFIVVWSVNVFVFLFDPNFVCRLLLETRFSIDLVEMKRLVVDALLNGKVFFGTGFVIGPIFT